MVRGPGHESDRRESQPPAFEQPLESRNWDLIAIRPNEGRQPLLIGAQICRMRLSVEAGLHSLLRQADLENSFQVPDAVPARFIVDHWCPHSSIRARAATFRDRGSVSVAPEVSRPSHPGFAIRQARADVSETDRFGTCRSEVSGPTRARYQPKDRHRMHSARQRRRCRNSEAQRRKVAERPPTIGTGRAARSN